jgi:hypothetical protein
MAKPTGFPALKGDPSALRALVSAQKADSLAATQSAKLTLERERADRYYMGDMEADLPAEEGRSQAISSDVADTVEGMLPNLIDIVAGADEVVKFEPVGPGDEQQAQQETDYVNHVFMQENDGFRILYDFTKDGLLSKNGVVKVFWETKEEEEKEDYYDLTDDQFAMIAQQVLMSDGGLKIVAHSQRQDQKPGPDGQMMPYTCHDVTVLQTKKLAQARILGVPPEEFGIERNARDIKSCNYCFHEVVTKTRADLIGEGYDEDQVMRLPEYTGLQTPETLARDSVWEHASGGGTTWNTAAQCVRVTEHYVRMDYEGDGKPRLYKVVTGGDDGELLLKDGEPDVVEWDVIPLASWTPIPISHRFFGRSIADLVIPIQKEKTALKRGALDNLYMVTSPRVEVAEAMAGVNTLDDLLVSRPGGVIRTKQPGGLTWQVTPPIVDSVFPALQYLDADLESKTGLAKQTQGIDANALQNQTAEAVNQVFTASQMRLKLVARNLAEGVKDIFWLLHQIIQKNANEAAQVYLKGKWTEIDPRDWKTRNHLTIHVALGTGSKSQQFAQMMAIGNVQKELLAGGKAHMVGDDKLFNTASALTKIMGHKNPDQFFDDPSAKDPQTGQLLHPPAPPPPDPKVQVAQIQAQNKQQETAQKAQLDQQKAQLDAYHQQIKAQTDAMLAQFKHELDAKLKLIDAAVKVHQADQQMAHKHQEHQLHVAETVVGMHHDQQRHEASLEAMKQKPKADA